MPVVLNSGMTEKSKQQILFETHRDDLKQVLAVHKSGIETNSLLTAYLSHTDCDKVPLKEMGFSSWKEFLYECRSILEVGILREDNPHDPSAKLFVFLNPRVDVSVFANILQLIQEQERKKPKKSRDGRTREPTRNQVKFVDPSILISGNRRGPMPTAETIMQALRQHVAGIVGPRFARQQSIQSKAKPADGNGKTSSSSSGGSKKPSNAGQQSVQAKPKPAPSNGGGSKKPSMPSNGGRPSSSSSAGRGGSRSGKMIGPLKGQTVPPIPSKSKFSFSSPSLPLAVETVDDENDKNDNDSDSDGEEAINYYYASGSTAAIAAIPEDEVDYKVAAPTTPKKYKAKPKKPVIIRPCPPVTNPLPIVKPPAPTAGSTLKKFEFVKSTPAVATMPTVKPPLESGNNAQKEEVIQTNPTTPVRPSVQIRPAIVTSPVVNLNSSYGYKDDDLASNFSTLSTVSTRARQIVKLPEITSVPVVRLPFTTASNTNEPGNNAPKKEVIQITPGRSIHPTIVNSPVVNPSYSYDSCKEDDVASNYSNFSMLSTVSTRARQIVKLPEITGVPVVRIPLRTPAVATLPTVKPPLSNSNETGNNAPNEEAIKTTPGTPIPIHPAIAQSPVVNLNSSYGYKDDDLASNFSTLSTVSTRARQIVKLPEITSVPIVRIPFTFRTPAQGLTAINNLLD